MSIEDFLGRLEAVSPTGEGKWIARCPAHPDGNPSLGVAVGTDGRILLHCYAGCTAEAIVGAMGLGMRDLIPEQQVEGGRLKVERRKKQPPKVKISEIVKGKRDYGKLVCAYDYQNAEGAVVFRVERRVMANGKKTFVQSHPDPTSKFGWKWGVTSAGVERVPFRLPRILAAGKAGKSVIVVEGEKDVLTVERTLGVAATCNPGGAGKWEAGWGKFFEGVSTVCIIADKDPLEVEVKAKGKGQERKKKLHAVGQRHACDVEAKLRADGFTGAIKKMFMPDVGETHVKDFTDWAEAVEAAGGKADKAAFQEVIKNFTGWPEEWEFGEQVEGGRLKVEGDGGKDWTDDDSCVGEGLGRFGRPVPRTPFGSERLYEVDFRKKSDYVIRLAISTKRYFLRVFGKVSGGGWSLKNKCGPYEMPLAAMTPMTCGMMKKFFPDDKDAAKVNSEMQAAICLMWLRSRGKFFWDENAKGFATSLFFDEQTGVLMRVRSDEFAAFMATAAEINRESSGFKYLMSLIDDAAMSKDVSRGVIPSNMWDRRGDVVYISSGDAEMYRISTSADKVQNGTDGVVFMRGKTFAPWELEAGGGKDPFATAKIFTHASWSDKTGVMNIRLWTLNLLACHQTKPILLITGAMQSGKTRMAKAIKEILGVRTDGRLDLSVQQVEDGDKGLDAFWATVNDGKLEVFDNLDTKVKWVSDTLQNVATDGQTKRRTLYTTFGVSILRANAHIILTSNNPLFSTDGNGGMADRLISVHLTTNRSVAMDTELSEDIAANRNAFMTWIARTVSAALADKREVDTSINRRHPDYGRFSVRCGRAFGDEDGVVAALGAAEADKSLLPLRNDTITKEVLLVLEKRDWSMRFTSGDMSDAILAMMGDDETDDKSRMIYGSRRVGKAMAKYERQFAVLFNFSKRILEGKTLYEFVGLTAQGRLALGDSVDKVDLEPTFSESTRERKGAGALSENGTSNTPNPPYARARADDTSFDVEEEISKENGGDDDLVW